MKGDESFARNNARARKLAVLFCYRSLLITYAIIISEKLIALSSHSWRSTHGIMGVVDLHNAFTKHIEWGRLHYSSV